MTISREIKKRYVGIEGSQQIKYVASAEHTLSGASYTFTGLIPAGAVLEGITAKVLTAITGASSSNVGDGSTADLYAAALALAKGTELGSTNYKSSATFPKYLKTAGDVVFTAVGSNYTAGKVRVSAHYYMMAI